MLVTLTNQRAYGRKKILIEVHSCFFFFYPSLIFELDLPFLADSNHCGSIFKLLLWCQVQLGWHFLCKFGCDSDICLSSGKLNQKLSFDWLKQCAFQMKSLWLYIFLSFPWRLQNIAIYNERYLHKIIKQNNLNCSKTMPFK